MPRPGSNGVFSCFRSSGFLTTGCTNTKRNSQARIQTSAWIADKYNVTRFLHSPCRVQAVRACKVIRGMRGGSQAQLVLTDKGLYVCKWKHNPQHRRVLINEAIGSQLLALLGIATPDWAIVEVDEGFIAANPLACISWRSESVPIVPGMHFGSRFPVDPETTAVYVFLPTQLADRIVNLQDFIRVLVFDLWTDNSDGRQAIFFKSNSGCTG
jgi:hypothetical protein